MQLSDNKAAILTYFTFTTARLRLEPIDSSSIELLAKLYGCSKTMQYIADPLSFSKIEKMMSDIMYKQQRQHYDTLLLRIKHKDNETDFGIGGMPYLNLTNKEAEVGVMLLPLAQGKGLAVEVVKALVNMLKQLDVNTIYMNIDPDNKAAIIGATKAGFAVSSDPSRYVFQ
ncbi:GNAT family N-acetyltransferase [Rheinheimera sp. WS51]|uniref:GNAT family N-acetyltransferase n=1 Tax=Rheinheimera sp. WS51 TaxID=3425886 RepID=UPI003D92BB0A